MTQDSEYTYKQLSYFADHICELKKSLAADISYKDELYNERAEGMIKLLSSVIPDNMKNWRWINNWCGECKAVCRYADGTRGL